MIKKKMTTMNRCIFSFVGFFQSRWKTVMIVTLSGLFLFEMHRYSRLIQKVNESLYQLQPLEGSLPNRNIDLYHPQCMSDWINGKSNDKNIAFVKSKLERFVGSVFIRNTNTSRYHCTPNHKTIPRFISTGRQRFFGHFPHFAEIYFKVFSLLLWQHRVYSSDPCIHELQVDKNRAIFWSVMKQKHSWSRDLVRLINRSFRMNTIASNIGKSFFDVSRYETIELKNSEGYFLHPADSILLTSLILHQNPCANAGRGKDLLSRDLNILIVNRKTSRKILNIQNVTDLFHQITDNYTSVKVHHSESEHHWPHKIGFVNHTYFESQTLFDQAYQMNQADIVFSVHGAQLTNVVFMKPCSVLIEVMPWLYNVPSYFGSFSESSDVIHLSWEENATNSVMASLFPHDFSNSNSHSCFHYRLKYQRLKESGKFSDSELGNLCYHDGDGECRSCARTVDGIVVSLDKLQHYVKLAMKSRHKCILEHPFYNVKQRL